MPLRTVSEPNACVLIAVWASSTPMMAFMSSDFRSGEFAKCSFVLLVAYCVSVSDYSKQGTPRVRAVMLSVDRKTFLEIWPLGVAISDYTAIVLTHGDKCSLQDFITVELFNGKERQTDQSEGCFSSGKSPSRPEGKQGREIGRSFRPVPGRRQEEEMMSGEK